MATVRDKSAPYRPSFDLFIEKTYRYLITVKWGNIVIGINIVTLWLNVQKL